MIQFGIVKYGILKKFKEKSSRCNYRGDSASGSCSEDDILQPTQSTCIDNDFISTEPLATSTSTTTFTSTTSSDQCNNEFENEQQTISHSDLCDKSSVKSDTSVAINPNLMDKLALTTTLPSNDLDQTLSKSEEHRIDETKAMRHSEDAANNNSSEGDDEMEDDVEGDEPDEELIRPDLSALAAGAAAAAFTPGHVTLEALQNTKVAVAQFAASAMANPNSEAALKELAVLQSTLFTLQHQQVLQLQLIQQLQSHLTMNNQSSNKDDGEEEEGSEDGDNDMEQCQSDVDGRDEDDEEDEKVYDDEELQDLQHMRNDSEVDKTNEVEMNPEVLPLIRPRIMTPENKISGDVTSDENLTTPTSKSQTQTLQQSVDVNSPPMAGAMCHYNSSLASTIITNHDSPPSMDAPNSLEMLQKRAQEVLDSASQGLLAGNLADELAFRRDRSSPFDGKGGRNEPFFKHRCRYCGKVFGSDSALQIHIRSHTGERPFKCNVCGSRFTTKGNLKVHFQRHTSKFPHIQMNPNPIPEHLDKYHPPLISQLSPVHGPSPNHPPPHSQIPVTVPVPFPPGASFPGLPLYRPPLDLLKPLGCHSSPHHLFGIPPPLNQEQEIPADLSKPTAKSATPPPSPVPEPKDSEMPVIKEEPCDEDQMLSLPPACDIDLSNEHGFTMNRIPLSRDPSEERISNANQNTRDSMSPNDHDSERFPTPSNFDDDLSNDTKFSDNPRDTQDQPENLSAAKILPNLSPHSSASSTTGSMLNHHNPSLPDSVRESAMFSSLLPRPGSNDNSWESLIEINRTSETSKLQQLVDNIEHKLTDPNQCVVCHRILSCKSALQMHYRTHTGERPFRCRLCGRAFTTKGNLKTHMGVHRMKPPMRTLPQCPVCHKKYANALVLQQHIRQHTGEPTDLTAEQIRAAEVRDFPCLSPGSFAMGMNSFGMSMHGLPPGTLESESSQGDNDDYIDYNNDFDDEDGDEANFRDELGSESMPETPTCNVSTSISALENQVRTITTMASQLSASGHSRSADNLARVSEPEVNEPEVVPNGNKTPDVASPEPQRKCSPTPSETSQGALDLTPKSIPHPSPPMLHGHPPIGMFPGFSMLSRGPMNPSGPSLMNSALTSLAHSVMPAGPFNPLGLSGVRGNTTCNICFKTFACHSALEIHYRSHTKERPFKCTICDRGFSTKNEELVHTHFFPCKTGNMKQHMLTHKIRDMPQHMFGGNSNSNSESATNHIHHSSNSQPSQSSMSPQQQSSQTQPPPPQVQPLPQNNRPHSPPNFNISSESQEPRLDPMEKSQRSEKKEREIHEMRASTPEKCMSFDPPVIKQEPGLKRQPDVIMEEPLPKRPSTNATGPSQLLFANNPGVSLPITFPTLGASLISPPNSMLTLPRHTPPSPLHSHNHHHRSRDDIPPPSPHRDRSAGYEDHLQRMTNMNQSSGERIGLPHTPSHLSQNSSTPEAINTKHLCSVCRKNFSSSSALQIHMRTHTGDKPFRCNVCQKAFTTKGNLKVHMGTHMWSNGASRRGRRMSLELPLNRPLTLSPQDSEFLQRRPDLFYPYLPAPFLNGMQQKLNEMNVMHQHQMGGPPPGLISPPMANKYAGFLGLGSFMPSSMPPGAGIHHSPSPSPISDKPPSSVSPPHHNGSTDLTDSPPPSTQSSRKHQSPHQIQRMWDLRYDRKPSVSEGRDEKKPPLESMALVSPPSRSEGLAA